MAGEDNGSSGRAITEDQSKEESAKYEHMFKHFHENKVEIASAITKPFPFLMSLRDRGFISEQKFQDSQERCQNLVPVSRVVYDILSDLQNKFSLLLLEVIFSKTHLKAYPDLKETLRSFLDVSSSHRTPQRVNGRDAEERPGLPGFVKEGIFFPVGCRRNIRSTEASCSPGNSQMNDEQAEEVPSLSQCNGGGKKKGHNWSRVKWRRPTNDSRAGGQTALRRKKMKKNPGPSAKTRVPRKRRYENVDFSAELLPVTCGDMKGVLSKDKFKQGISTKSIQSEDGDWYTPPEFEILGGHGQSKNWRLSLRCYNWPLKFLIQENFLPNPPRIYGRKKKRTQNLYCSPADPCMQNSDECEVCRDVGTLFCCDTCSRAFHEECHIPTVEAERTPWSCIFCRMQSLGSQQSHPESEVLQRRMVPQEQLKCDFVLLKVYCCSESSFFSKMPHYCYFRETSVGVQKAMWLDIIKKKLRRRGYSHVGEFVQDMRLIFHNHRTTFKDVNFGQMGLRLESEFEKTFKEVFAIQDTNENS
ncbi:nuclear body protein SP140-like protein isoform X13 [Peromyscus maniculatus bairdii]|uniref:nuclear body protein SP140-like protein isoform X13 n=1 Tax=Peromyscus maniculatus bairdii TaxID=230844 RepID=UPI001C2EED73|nr:nuclear body protein SP140-like protein isoform X13 [Peromyscus maniculatus bairdii]